MSKFTHSWIPLTHFWTRPPAGRRWSAMSRPSPTTAVRQSGTTTLKGSLDRPANPLDRAHRRRRPTTTAAQSPTAP